MPCVDTQVERPVMLCIPRIVIFLVPFTHLPLSGSKYPNTTNLCTLTSESLKSRHNLAYYHRPFFCLLSPSPLTWHWAHMWPLVDWERERELLWHINLQRFRRRVSKKNWSWQTGCWPASRAYHIRIVARKRAGLTVFVSFQGFFPQKKKKKWRGKMKRTQTK